MPIRAASAAPSRRALCCTAVVKKEDEGISSQRSKLQSYIVVIKDALEGILTWSDSTKPQHSQGQVE